MSKIVKRVGKAVSKVVKGVTKAVKKVASSSLGKIVLTAAAVYFGGAALSGGFGAPAGSGLSGFISGAGQGLSNAWAGLIQAGGSALSGNFAQAGSQLTSGFQGQLANVGANASSALTAGSTALGPIDYSLTSSIGGPGIKLASAVKPPETGGGFLSGLSGLGQAAAISTGGQLIGGLVQGVGAQKQANAQKKKEDEARNRYNTNVGTVLPMFQQNPGGAAQVPTYGTQTEELSPEERYALQPVPEYGNGLIGGIMVPQYTPTRYRA